MPRGMPRRRGRGARALLAVATLTAILEGFGRTALVRVGPAFVQRGPSAARGAPPAPGALLAAGPRAPGVARTAPLPAARGPPLAQLRAGSGKGEKDPATPAAAAGDAGKEGGDAEDDGGLLGTLGRVIGVLALLFVVLIINAGFPFCVQKDLKLGESLGDAVPACFQFSIGMAALDVAAPLLSIYVKFLELTSGAPTPPPPPS